MLSSIKGHFMCFSVIHRSFFYKILGTVSKKKFIWSNLFTFMDVFAHDRGVKQVFCEPKAPFSALRLFSEEKFPFPIMFSKMFPVGKSCFRLLWASLRANSVTVSLMNLSIFNKLGSLNVERGADKGRSRLVLL